MRTPSTFIQSARGRSVLTISIYMYIWSQHTDMFHGYNWVSAIALGQLQLSIYVALPLFSPSRSSIAFLITTPLQLLKIKKSTARNELSYETEHKSEEAESFGETIARRVQVTAEVAVSKIFHAGK